MTRRERAQRGDGGRLGLGDSRRRPTPRPRPPSGRASSSNVPSRMCAPGGSAAGVDLGHPRPRTIGSRPSIAVREIVVSARRAEPSERPERGRPHGRRRRPSALPALRPRPPGGPPSPPHDGGRYAPESRPESDIAHLRSSRSRIGPMTHAVDDSAKVRAPVSHMVSYRGTDGKQSYHQVDELGRRDAVCRASAQCRIGRCVLGIFKLEELSFEYRPYYRVELAAALPPPHQRPAPIG